MRQLSMLASSIDLKAVAAEPLMTVDTSSSPLVIATRESRLALWQAEHVQALLRARGHTVELLGMTTKGDQILDRTLSKVGGKGLLSRNWKWRWKKAVPTSPCTRSRTCPWTCPKALLWPA